MNYAALTVGAAIISIALGSLSSEEVGWTCFGACIVVLAIVHHWVPNTFHPELNDWDDEDEDDDDEDEDEDEDEDDDEEEDDDLEPDTLLILHCKQCNERYTINQAEHDEQFDDYYPFVDEPPKRALWEARHLQYTHQCGCLVGTDAPDTQRYGLAEVVGMVRKK